MKQNKGFSLVEIIIVIAIMAILIGALAPAMIQYVNKARITADQQLLQAIYEAVVYASSDAEVTSDPDSQTVLQALKNGPCTLESLMTPANNQLAKQVQETLGWSDLNQATYEKRLRSTHASNCTIYITSQGRAKNPLVMWITTTDKTGGHDTSNTSNTVAGIGNCISIQ